MLNAFTDTINYLNLLTTVVETPPKSARDSA